MTTTIIMLLIIAGLLTLLIWLWRALRTYPRDEAAHTPAAAVEHDLATRVTPAKLGWNWGAFFLGPIWFLLEGLWVYAIILTVLILLSGGILLPFVMLYSGLKANETRADQKLAQHTVY